MPMGWKNGEKPASRPLPPKLQSVRDSAKQRIMDWATKQKADIDIHSYEQERKLNLIIKECLEDSERFHQENSSKSTKKSQNSNNRAPTDTFHDVKVPDIRFIEYEKSIQLIEIITGSFDDEHQEIESARARSNPCQPQIRNSQSSTTDDATSKNPQSRGTSASRARRQKMQNELQLHATSSSSTMKTQQKKTVTNNDYDTLVECPYCLMIFPKGFSETRRMQHISSHE